jgi:hypothetical protein
MPATRPLSYAKVAANLPAALLQASHVYVWRGGTIPPLAPLYVGLYEVLEQAGKFFWIAVGGCEETVSIGHLKPHLGAALSQRLSLRHAAGLHPPLLWFISLSSLQQLRLAWGHVAERKIREKKQISLPVPCM